MSAADLSVGVIEIFLTCLRGYKIITTSLSCPEEQQSLYHRTRTQRARLTVWGDYFGLTHSTSRRYDATEKLRAHLKSSYKIGPEILDTLNNVAELFVNGRALQEVYGLYKVAEAEDGRELLLLDPDVADIAIHGASRLPMSKARLDANREAIAYLSHCDWEITDPDRYSALLHKLKAANDDLYLLALPQAREMMDRALLSELLADKDDVLTLLHIRNATAEDAEDDSPPSRGFFSGSYHTLAQAAKLRARGNIDPFLKRRLLRPPTILERADFALHPQLAWVGGDACLAVTNTGSAKKVVLVEFKSYLIDDRAHRRLEDLVHRLAELLCAGDKPFEFRLPPCSGYFHDPSKGRFGFVYELPPYLHLRHAEEARVPAAMSMRKPHSLMQLLKHLEPIDLGDRFRLAKQLVAAVYTIHACGFSHKNIRPASILFLPAESGDRGGGPSKSRKVALRRPYLMGWGYTRPDELEFEADHERRLIVPRDGTVGIYQHPERLKSPYRPYKQIYDIYSLGLVLLEIGLWQSIESFVSEIKDFTTDEFTLYLRKRVVPDLRGQCGAIYEEVVQSCLAMKVDVEVATERVMLWDVMARLENCRA
ncbi:hypothetical protein FN846DRAFT_941011 [Sphaerosporella brunnea]|uniref:Protein kinase domain-containing protein n=1 Tax=Sphaerosporella brunnea TaxID=1250544 RepID=A0A5J5F2T3_9PEZI|nr:hypothetical protein FN846DRAFT_941011 [Sphaerosporella brunnea]